MNPQKKDKMSVLKKWIIAIRPFALPASSSPVIFGTVLAAFLEKAPFNILYFGLALLGMMILHSGANVLSDITDFKKGLDTRPTPVSGALVRDLITIDQAWKAVIVLLLLGSGIGIFLVSQIGLSLLWIGLLGLMIGILYTRGGFLSLKYHALGDLAVFFNFGILGTLGAWVVQTHRFSWIPVILAVPISLLVIAILHANNWRDLESDSKIGVKTLAIIFKDRGSLRYYGFLVFFPFIYLVGLVLLGNLVFGWTFVPYTFLIVLLALPKAVSLYRQALRRKNPEHPLEFITLDGATAQLNLLFGLLCSAAIVVYSFL